MKKALAFILFLIFHQVNGQTLPAYYTYDKDLSNSLQEIVNSLDLNKNFNVGEDGQEQISFAVIDLNGPKPLIGGVNMDNFIYPASVYKMYVAAQVLAQVSAGRHSLLEPYVIKAPNDVDSRTELKDPRPVIKEGDTLTINYLLDLMITRSDNSAANCMIDIAGRPAINEMMHHYGWQGSEVTRKFLKRKFEDPGYDTVRGTMTSALHAADFMYRVYTNEMINPWVSMQLKSFLGRQLDKSKLFAGLPANVMYYNKTGWFSYWTNDVGIVDDGKTRYIISCFIPLTENEAGPKMKEISSRVYKLISERHKKQL